MGVSVIISPALFTIFRGAGRSVSSGKNPLGAFVGLAFPVKYTYRTAQNPIMESFELKANARRTVRETGSGYVAAGR